MGRKKINSLLVPTYHLLSLHCCFRKAKKNQAKKAGKKIGSAKAIFRNLRKNVWCFAAKLRGFLHISPPIFPKGYETKIGTTNPKLHRMALKSLLFFKAWVDAWHLLDISAVFLGMNFQSKYLHLVYKLFPPTKGEPTFREPTAKNPLMNKLEMIWGWKGDLQL